MMNVHYGVDELPQIHNAVITVGSYDGIHQGHRQILSRLVDLAREIDGESVLITFHPHPRKVVYPDDRLDLLHTLEEKKEAVEALGIDHLVVIPFSKEFSQQTPESYIKDFLVDKFHPYFIVIGYDHRYGRERKGDIELLKKHQQEYGFQVMEIEKHEIDHIAISSTKTRNALLNGDVETAHSYLSYPYHLSGTVQKGDQIGRTIGYPTANIEVDEEDKLIPGDGIYAVTVDVKGQHHKGMLYIGNRPSLEQSSAKKIEVHIFGFHQDIYGEKIRVTFFKKTREDEKYASLQELKSALDQDKKEVLSFFAGQENPLVTLAILNYNGKNYLEKYLPSMRESSILHRWKLLIIDNHSDDGSVDFVRENYPETDIIEVGENLGFTGGYNYGLKDVDTKYIAIVNSDIEATPEWMDPLIEALDSDATLGSVQPKIKSLRQKELFEYAGACGGFMDSLGYPYCRGRIFDTLEEDKGQYDNPMDVDWTSGAAMIVRSELFHELDGFDEDYFAHMEEIDLCLRMHALGFKCRVIPKSKVYHWGGGTLGYDNPRKVYYNFRNSLYTLFKNENGRSLLWKLPIRLVLDGVAGVRFLLQGNISALWAVFRSHMALYAQLPRLMAKRRLIKRTKSYIGRKPEGKKIFSIVVDYFLRGRKKYSEL